MDEAKVAAEMSGHTPGPWRREDDGIMTGRGVTTGHDVMAGSDADPVCVAADVRSEADARLIAAAPAYYDAVAELLKITALLLAFGAAIPSELRAQIVKLADVQNAVDDE